VPIEVQPLVRQRSEPPRQEPTAITTTTTAATATITEMWSAQISIRIDAAASDGGPNGPHRRPFSGLTLLDPSGQLATCFQPSWSGNTLPSSIHYWHGHAACRSALPRDELAPNLKGRYPLSLLRVGVGPAWRSQDRASRIGLARSRRRSRGRYHKIPGGESHRATRRSDV
jgi:hypothetical protein